MNVSSLDYNAAEQSQQSHSVTLIEKMSKGTNDENDLIWFRQLGGITIKSDYIPLLIGAVISVFLVLLLFVALLLWKCCISKEEQKTREAINIATIEKSYSNNQNYTNGFLDQGTPHIYSSRVVELIPEQDGPVCWLYRNHEFVKVPYGSTGNTPCSINNVEVTVRPPRPRSNPVVTPSISSLVDDYALPEISEFCAHPCQYVSSSILDDCCTQGHNINNFKTQSLPSCVRQKRRSSSDNTNDFYDKVNFSKKRKNRMRNDEAAIIALSRSRSQFFNKDTDVLVDNEAVIVYDERTAL